MRRQPAAAWATWTSESPARPSPRGQGTRCQVEARRARGTAAQRGTCDASRDPVPTAEPHSLETASPAGPPFGGGPAAVFGQHPYVSHLGRRRNDRASRGGRDHGRHDEASAARERRRRRGRGGSRWRRGCSGRLDLAVDEPGPVEAGRRRGRERLEPQPARSSPCRQGQPGRRSGCWWPGPADGQRVGGTAAGWPGSDRAETRGHRAGPRPARACSPVAGRAAVARERRPRSSPGPGAGADQRRD